MEGLSYQIIDLPSGAPVFFESVEAPDVESLLRHVAQKMAEHVALFPSLELVVHCDAYRIGSHQLSESSLESLGTIFTLAADRHRPMISESKEPVEELKLPVLKVGDTMLIGKFKNRLATIKGFFTDEHGQPVAETDKGDVPIFKGRISKLIPAR